MSSALARSLVPVLVLFAWSPAAPPPVVNPQPNILLIVLDDVGPDKLAMFGETPAAHYAQPPYCGPQTDPFPYPRTPILDQLASGQFTGKLTGLAGGGIRFTNAYCATICNPGRACILTGRY